MAVRVQYAMPTRSINGTFTEEEFRQLKEVKGDNRTWEKAIREEFGIDE